jgi:hypothetical protein
LPFEPLIACHKVISIFFARATSGIKQAPKISASPIISHLRMLINMTASLKPQHTLNA